MNFLTMDTVDLELVQNLNSFIFGDTNGMEHRSDNGFPSKYTQMDDNDDEFRGNCGPVIKS